MRLVLISLILALVVIPAAVAQGGPPDESGPIVVRGDDATLAVTWVDFRNSTRIVLGADIVEFCSGIVDFSEWEFQQVLNPSGDWPQVLVGEDLVTSVWPFIAFDCELFLEEEPLATGFTSGRYTDNDPVFPWEGNAWGYMVRGTLYNGGGKKKRLNAIARCYIDGQASNSPDGTCTAHINLH